MSPDRRRLRDVVVDVDDDALASALEVAFAPHRVHRVHRAAAGSTAAAVAILAGVVSGSGGGVVVCGPATPDQADPDEVHRHIALRAHRWATAAPVVGSRLVLVSTAEVFAGRVRDAAEPGGYGPDEFTVPVPATVVGRARRAAEVVATGSEPAGVVVRMAAGDDPAAVADTVRWAAIVARAGTCWHHPGTGGALDARHTRLVRAETAPAGAERRGRRP